MVVGVLFEIKTRPSLDAGWAVHIKYEEKKLFLFRFWQFCGRVKYFCRQRLGTAKCNAGHNVYHNSAVQFIFRDHAWRRTIRSVVGTIALSHHTHISQPYDQRVPQWPEWV